MLKSILNQFTNSYQDSPFDIHAKGKLPSWLDQVVRGLNAPLIWGTQILPNWMTRPLLKLIPGVASVLHRGIFMTLKVAGNLLKHVVWCAIGLVFSAYYLVRSLLSLGQNQYYNKNLFDILRVDVIRSLMALPVCVLDGVYGLLVMVGDEISQIINSDVTHSSSISSTDPIKGTNPLASQDVPLFKNVAVTDLENKGDDVLLVTPQKQNDAEVAGDKLHTPVTEILL